MIQRIKDILIIGLVVGIVLLSFFSIKGSNKYDELLKSTQEKELILNQKNLDIQYALDERVLVIGVLREEIKEKDSIKNSYFSNASYFKTKYEDLVNNGYVIAETTEDSLKVCLNVSESLFNEAINLRKTVEIQNAISVNRIEVISNLEKNIIDMKEQLVNKDVVIEMWKDQAILAQKVIKKEKKKSFIKGTIIGVPVGIVVVLLLL